MKKKSPFLRLVKFGCDARCFGCGQYYTTEGMPTILTMLKKYFLLDIGYDTLLHMEVDGDVNRLQPEQGSEE